MFEIPVSVDKVHDIIILTRKIIQFEYFAIYNINQIIIRNHTIRI